MISVYVTGRPSRVSVSTICRLCDGRKSQSVEKLAKSQWQVAGSSFARRSASVRPRSKRSIATVMAV